MTAQRINLGRAVSASWSHQRGLDALFTLLELALVVVIVQKKLAAHPNLLLNLPNVAQSRIQNAMDSLVEQAFHAAMASRTTVWTKAKRGNKLQRAGAGEELDIRRGRVQKKETGCERRRHPRTATNKR